MRRFPPCLLTSQPTETMQVTVTNTAVTTVTAPPPENTLAPDVTPSPYNPCYRGQAGLPFDLTIPDDTEQPAGAKFTKIWRMVNAGTCTWDSSYKLVFFSGDQLGFTADVPLTGMIDPGDTVDVIVELTAPMESGTYQGYYKLRAPDGTMFGIGPEGQSPFWVRIVVTASATETATAEAATSTPTPMVARSTTIQLIKDMGVDLESGLVTTTETEDVSYTNPDGNPTLNAINGAVFGDRDMVEPDLATCQNAELNVTSLDATAEAQESWVCVRSNGGLPGKLQLLALDPDGGSVTISYTLWSLP